MEMDDNENFVDYQKMNFSSFAPQFSPSNAVNQFAAGKFAQNLSANGQVLGLVAGPDGEVHYLNTPSSHGGSPIQGSGPPTSLSQQLITLPITMPGAKPGDAQQTVQIQVVNPNSLQSSSNNHQSNPLLSATTGGGGGGGGGGHQKFSMGQMQIPIQNFQQGTTVLTVAYAPQDGDVLQNHGLPEGMTVVAAIQPQDLHMLAQAYSHQQSQNQHNNGDNEDKDPILKSIKQEPPDLHRSSPGQQQSQTQQTVQIPWQNAVSGQAAADLSEYLVRLQQQHQPPEAIMPVQLNQFLKFNADAIKRESATTDGPPLNGLVINCDYAQLLQSQAAEQPDNNNNNEAKGTDGDGGGGGEKGKKKRKYKKKPPKPKRPKPGQVHIATALDGTVLFCCPECHRAYPEKENLEQHLSTHKIERRFICDICGAGLKRKEHLERHKLGHNPDRPYICSVCLKGFKRKEHLNLHFVIHSGEKTEICGECGKGFYRKDHLRKHAKSHALKRQKELNAQAVAAGLIPPGKEVKAAGTKSGSSKKKKAANSAANATVMATVSAGESSIPIFEIPLSTSTSMGGTPTTVTASVNIPKTSITAGNTTIIHIPTGDNTTLPVQIQLPHCMVSHGDSMGASHISATAAGQSNELPIMGS